MTVLFFSLDVFYIPFYNIFTIPLIGSLLMCWKHYHNWTLTLDVSEFMFTLQLVTDIFSTKNPIQLFLPINLPNSIQAYKLEREKNWAKRDVTTLLWIKTCNVIPFLHFMNSWLIFYTTNSFLEMLTLFVTSQWKICGSVTWRFGKLHIFFYCKRFSTRV